MKNVIKPQSYSVDAFEILNIVFGSAECRKSFCRGRVSRWNRKRDTRRYFSDEAIKFSYLYHSNLERIGRFGEAEARRFQNCVISTTRHGEKLCRPMQFDIASQILFRKRSLNKKILTNCCTYIFPVCIFALASRCLCKDEKKCQFASGGKFHKIIIALKR